MNRSIEDFLGPDICNNPIVKNSKLTNNEIEFFESPITLDQLDKAMEKTNKRSAAGVDGYPCYFID